jgi:uncharacterized membrane protein YkvI
LAEVVRGALFIVGTSIGAGFLSGAELVRFFHTERFFLPVLLSTLLYFGACVLYLRLGKKYGGFDGTLKSLFGRAGKAVRILVSLSAFIPCAGMLAGLDALLPACKPLLSILGLVAITVCLKYGMKGISILNSVLVPVLLIFIFYYGIGGLHGLNALFSVGREGYLGGIVYAFMNAFLAAPVLLDAGKNMKNPVLPAGIAGILIAAGAVCILGSVYAEGGGAVGAELPFLFVMRGRKIFYVAAAFAILTSLASSLYPLLKLSDGLRRKQKYAAKGATLLAAFALSRIGLSGIVRVLYPVLGIAGILLSVLCIFNEYFFKQYYEKIHFRRKQTQNARCGHHEIELKHLPAVHDQITESRARNDVFAHNRTDPRHTHVYFQHRNKRSKR